MKTKSYTTKGSHVRTLRAAMLAAVAGGAIAMAIALDPSTAAAQVAAIQTSNGDYLTAVNGGDEGGLNCGPEQLALHTDATSVGPWELFDVTWLGSNKFALMTSDHEHYVTAVNGGGMGSIYDTQPIHTNATKVGPDEEFVLNFSNNNSTVTLQTADGRYVTAANGGGCGTTNTVPIHTNATKIGPWETFTLNFLIN